MAEIDTGMLICPFCLATLVREGGSYYCGGERRHCFDISKSGYVTLTGASGTSGDDRDMVRARTAFLDAGYYKPFADAVITALAAAETVVDAGCGEGYYSNAAALAGSRVYGFDLSKYACDRAAKRARACGANAFFGVASAAALPLSDGCADAVVSLFAPVFEKEFARILKPGGKLIIGAAGRRHLYELKEAIYDRPYENEGRRDLPVGFTEISRKNVSYTFNCAGEHLRPLFMMTPYAFKTSKEDSDKLDRLSGLEITADFDIYVYRKD